MLPLGWTSQELMNAALSLGSHRDARRLSPMEIAVLFERAIRVGADHDTIAKACGLTGSTLVSRFLKLTKLHEDLRHLVAWGSPADGLSFSTAVEISRLSFPMQSTVGATCLTHRLTKDEVRAIVQRHQRSGVDLEACINEILKLRPSIYKQYLMIGRISDESLSKYLRTISQADRDSIISRLFSMAPEYQGLNGRLGVSSFSVTGYQSCDLDLLESRISAAVRESQP